MDVIIQTAPAAAVMVFGIIESFRTRSSVMRMTAVTLTGIAGAVLVYIMHIV